MKLKDIPKDELELMSYDEIAYVILSDSKKKMKINDLFQKVCETIGLSQKDFENQIADFFELLTINKKFVMLKNGYWDLRTRHSEKIVVEDDDDDMEEIIDTEPDADEEETKEDEDLFYDKDEEDDTPDDDLKDLVVVDEDNEEL